MPRLSDELGIDLWIKREDLLGFAMGGNKVRKAEYLIADAVSRGATHLITAGAVQSNHARVIAAAAAYCGLRCTLVLSGSSGAPVVGNLLLDSLAGASILVVDTGAMRADAMQRAADELRAAGETPYVIPIGGSSAVGAEAYVAAWMEITEQLGPKFTLISATSSGGTLAGLYAGWVLGGRQGSVLGIRVDNDPEPERVIAAVANEVLDNLGSAARLSEEEITLSSEFVGAGYGVPSSEGLAAIRTAWRSEGVLLDPVYSGKAFAGLLGSARNGCLQRGPVVFLHTGGAPGALALGEGLLRCG
jgi:D-cysteine desulfhydrase